MSEMQASVRTFLRDGVAYVPVNPKLHDLTYIAAAWLMRLLDEPEEILMHWENLEMGLPGDPETGLLRRDGQKKHTGNGVYDHKDTFHFRMSVRERLAMRGVEPGHYETWLELCESILRESISTMLLFAAELDRELPGHRFVQALRSGWHEELPAYHRHVFRLLRYRSVPNEILAQDHLDRSLISLQGAASAPGLEGFVGNSVRAFHTREGQALIFAGRKLELITGGAIPAWRHWVRNHPSERLRWSGVVFGHSNTDLPEHKQTEQAAVV